MKIKTLAAVAAGAGEIALTASCGSGPAPMSPALKSWCAAQRPTYVLEREIALAPITPQQGITYAEKALVLAARMNHAGCLPRIR